MTDRRPTDLQIAAALRTHLPATAPAGLRDEIGQGTATLAQRRGLPFVFGALTDADPIARRRAMLVAAAALLLAAVAGAAAIGALRRLETTPVVPVGATGRMAYVVGNDLYVANPDGTSPALVAHVDGAELTGPHWSADGRWIAVQTPEPAILVVDLGNGYVRRVAGGSFGDWSPDSRSIAYFTLDGEIALADVAGATTRVLVARTPGGGSLLSGWGDPLAFSPDGRWLIDDTGQGDPARPFGLYRIDVATGATTVLDTGRESFHYQADWAPDSRHVVLTVEGDRRASDTIWVVDIDGTETAEIQEDAAVTAPRWSPEGSWIAYLATRLDGRELMIARPDGRDHQRLAGNVDSIVGWSPDGKSIAYRVTIPDEAGDRSELHVVTIGADDRVLDLPPDSRELEWAITTDGPAGPSTSLPAVTAPPDQPIVAPATGEPVLQDALSGTLAFRANPVNDVDCYVGVFRFPFDSTVLGPREPGVAPSGEGGGSGQATQQPMKAAYCTISFAPDGSSFIRADQLTSAYEIVGLDGAVIDGPFPYDPGPPVWSTAGGWIAKSICDGETGECQDSIERPDGTGRAELPGAPTWLSGDRAMTISKPDGSLLLGYGDGTELHPIGEFPKPSGWSPAGSTFAFVRDGDAWLAESDGTGIRNLTEFELGGATEASWSPDGRWIVVLQGSTLWAFTPDGSLRQRIGTDLGPIDRGDGAAWSVAWAPNGGALAVETTDGVVIVDTDDWSAVRLPDAAAPAWSPDGQFIAVIASGGYKVDVMRPDGTDRATVTTEIAGEPLVWLP